MVVRDTEEEARAAARHLLSALDDAEGDAIRSRSLDAGSSGVARQSALRAEADGDGYVEPLPVDGYRPGPLGVRGRHRG